MTTPLWRQMIEASDAILNHIGEIQDPDAAIALEHMKVIRSFLLSQRPTDRIAWALLTREIVIARRAAIATNDEGGPQAPAPTTTPALP